MTRTEALILLATLFNAGAFLLIGMRIDKVRAELKEFADSFEDTPDEEKG